MQTVRTQSVPALEKGLLILECLARSKRGLTLSQLTRSLGLPKSSVHCLLLTFQRCGYLHREEHSGRYRFGLRLLSLANMTLSGIALREQAAPFLTELMDKTRLTVHMAILEQDEAVLIAKNDPPGLLRVATWLGKQMGLHCTALGKALIAYLPEEEIDRLTQKHGLLRHNDNTIASARRLKQELAEIRKLGYSIDNEEEEIGVRCIGAPILDHGQRVVAAISITGTTAQINGETFAPLAQAVKQTAALISAHLSSAAAQETGSAVASV